MAILLDLPVEHVLTVAKRCAEDSAGHVEMPGLIVKIIPVFVRIMAVPQDKLR